MDYRILGPLEVDQDGRALLLGGRQQRALLALLLLHANEVVPVDQIVDELWPEAPPPSATRSVHALVSRLRRLLESDSVARNGDEGDNGVLLTRPHGYLLRVAPGELDLHRFESLLQKGRDARAAGQADVAASTLRDALAVWRGPPLAEFAHDSFAAVDIARLDELHLSALEERIEADLLSGRSTDLVGELEALVATHPLRERLRGQLMLALYRRGRQADALQVYQDTRRMLVDELGIEPSQALRRLEQAILCQEESLQLPIRRPVGKISRRRTMLPAVGVLSIASLVAVALVLHRASGSPVQVLPNSIVAIDASTGHIVADARTAGQPVVVAANEDGVWAADRGGLTISRIHRTDPSKVKTFRLDATTPTSIAATTDAVWLTVRGSLIRLGSEFGALAALDPDPLPPQYGAGAVAAGAAGVWFIGPSGARRIDPSSNRVALVVPEAEASGNSAAIAVSADTVWAAGETSDSSALYEIKGRGVVATVPLGGPPIGIAVGPDTIWIAMRAGDLVAVEAATAAIVGNLDVGDRATGVAVAGENVWVTSDDGTVRRVDADRRVVTKTIRLKRPAVAVTAAGDDVWVAVD